MGLKILQRHFLEIIALAMLLILSGCSDSSDNQGINATTGFYEIEPVSFSFQLSGLPTLNYTSSPARVMHYFFPADSSAQTKPLFVFFNGGPSCATCTGLFSLNTAPYSLDKTRTRSADYIKNPYCFTQMGNLLYIDAPNTGFSYNTVTNASDEAVRAAEFDAKNFNIYTDAAQFIRLLLRFLSDNPAIMKNDVIIVGESYGGVRAQLMLNMILFHERYSDGSRIYKDEKLADEIKNHFWKVFPQYSGQDISPETAALQFGTQILIEPLITGYQIEIAGEMFEESGSVIYQIAQDTGTTYEPCSAPGCDPESNAFNFVGNTARREVYQYSKPAGFIDEVSNFNLSRLNTVSVLSLITGTDATAMPYLAPLYRQDAYRSIQSSSADAALLLESPAFETLPAQAKMMIRHKAMLYALGEQDMMPEALDTLEEVLGILNPWDSYIVDCNMSAFNAFYDNSAISAGYDIDPMSAAVGDYFLQNLALIRTFITDCDLDLVIYAPAIPRALEEYPAKVNDVIWNAETNDGYIDVYYKPGSLEDVTTPYKRTIYFPRYDDSGHMVSLGQPEKFLADVERWLQD
jgi:pimeloyl-ACP methyl ester carboxylesterase